MAEVVIKGLEQLRANLRSFSDRRFESAIAEALNRTARQVADAWGKQLSSKLDRPERLTQRAAITKKRADVGSLSAVVGMRDSIANNGIAPAEYLQAHEFGTGDRRLRKFERALVASGAMPPGHKVVPGKHAKLDGYGNVSRGQIVAVLNQLGAALSEGYQQVISKRSGKRAATAAKQGRRYVPVPKAVGKIEAGIYERRDRLLLPVFFFVSSTRYTKRLSLMDEGRKVAEQRISAELMRAMERRMASLARRQA